ncbi:MAG: alanine racemase [Dehalococcoidia bacterium]
MTQNEIAGLVDRLARPLWAEIDLDAVAANVRALRAQAGRAELVAMVKANAYGHGAVAVGRAALEAGASRLGVVSVDEALQLRAAGVSAPILVVGYSAPAQAAAIVRERLTATVNSFELGQAIDAEALRQGTIAEVHIKVDTGLNRFGLEGEEAIALAESLRNAAGLHVEGLFTHLATADEADKAFVFQQFEAFRAVAERVDWIPLRHTSNTAGLLDTPALNQGMVRVGIGIYGLYPSPAVDRAQSLSPVMALKARLIRVHTAAPGDTVSYGRHWQAAGGERLGLVPCGYGDGYPRTLSGKGRVLVGDVTAPVLGTIAMDHLVIDITSSQAGEGDPIQILGGPPGSGVSADELGTLCETINYEMTTRISARVPRIYMRAGKPVAIQGLNDPFPVDLGSASF